MSDETPPIDLPPRMMRRWWPTVEMLGEIAGRLPLPNPVIPRTRRVMLTSTMVPETPPALDPEGICSRCNARRTIALVTEASEPPRFTRFCAACWKEVRSAYMADERLEPPKTARGRIAFMDRVHQEPQPPRSVESRSWDDAIDFIGLIMSAREDATQATELTPQALAELAAEIVAQPDIMDGPMPPEVEAFVRRFSAA